MRSCGLKKTVLEKIIKVLKSFPEVEEALLFGSRATGSIKLASDMDLAIKAPKLTDGKFITLHRY